MEGRIVITPGDLVKHADWKYSPLNSYRDEVGLVVSYDKREWYDSGKNQRKWVIVEWLPVVKPRCTVIFHVDTLVRVS